MIRNIVCEAEIDGSYEKLLADELDLNQDLINMANNYYYGSKTSYMVKCESLAKQLLMMILTDDDLAEIHSAHYRIKSIDSLVAKNMLSRKLS